MVDGQTGFLVASDDPGYHAAVRRLGELRADRPSHAWTFSTDAFPDRARGAGD